MAASVGSRFLTPWVGDQKPPPSPLASNPVIFRRYSTGIELLDRKKDKRASTVDPTMAPKSLRSSFISKIHGSGDDDLEDDRPRSRTNHQSKDDTTSLAEFLKNHEPPSSSFMSVPFTYEDDKDRESKWSKFMAKKRRSKSVPRPPLNIQLPDSAVSGVTIGGHRHIAISIPLDAMPFAADSKAQDPVDANNSAQLGGTRNEYATLPRNFSVQTYAGGDGTVTVYPAAAVELDRSPKTLSPQRSSVLSQQSISSSSLEENGSHSPGLAGNKRKSNRQSADGTTGTPTKGKAKQPSYFSIFPKRTDIPHPNELGMATLGAGAANGSLATARRPNNQQRSVKATSMVVTTSQKHRHPAHSASIDGLMSLVKDGEKVRDGENVRDGYSKKPLPKPPGTSDPRAKQQPYRLGVGFPSPITEELTDGSTGSSKRGVRRAVSAQSMLAVTKETPSRPSTAGSIQNRRDKVRDKKRRDMEAVRNAKLLKEQQRRQSEDAQNQPQIDADAQDEGQRPQTSSNNTLCPIVVVVDLQPSPGLPDEKSPKAPPSPSQMRLSRDMDSELYLEHKRNMMDKQILRLYDSYHENRLRDVERRIRRLERNGDVWLRALVPVLDDMSRNIKTIHPPNRPSNGDADAEGRGWASDDEISAAGAERKARSTKRTKAPTRRASLSRGRIVAGLIGSTLASDDSEWSDTMSRGEDVNGLGIIEPLMRELAGEARRRQQQIAERTADDWRHNTVTLFPTGNAHDSLAWISNKSTARPYVPGEMPSTPWIFICPSSRGIGRALTCHLLRRMSRSSVPILATTRQADLVDAKAALLKDVFSVPSSHSSFFSSSSSPSSSNASLDDVQQRQQDKLSKRLFVVRCDVTDESTIASAAQKAESLFPRDTHHLHLACALPGVLLNPEKSPAQVDADAALQSFRVNAVGGLLLAKHFFGFLPKKATAMPGYDHVYDDPDDEDEEDEDEDEDEAEEEAALRLPRHATWLNMSARVGSTTDNRSGGWFSYRASKAAVNSITRSLDIHLRTRAGDNAMAVAYHPGTVRTELSRDYWGGIPKERLFSTEYAAERLMDVVCGLDVENRGRCWDWKGTEVPP
ncbi:hypothetical protein TARUN_4848 [Trichoderma arundinaceum]|uniref:Uncharacterized protein n=1 Tax=Trichoderma arundinaceum TaxID=490622 RepID=A0A395NNA7_TRIAR|nr:hypothetical protein TARUN_4848 [Trichoderma arundinaceum]